LMVRSTFPPKHSMVKTVSRVSLPTVKHCMTIPAITPVIVCPGHAQVIALAPAYIMPQDGYANRTVSKPQVDVG
jgi:hypothetical protein